MELVSHVYTFLGDEDVFASLSVGRLVKESILHSYRDATSGRSFNALCTDAFVREVLYPCYNLQSLHLAGCMAVSNQTVCAIAQNNPQLAHVDLSGCKRITDVAVQALARNCRQLSSLKLCSCEISDAALMILDQECANLQRLDITGCKSVSYPSCIAIACRCKEFYCNTANMAGAGEYPHVSSLEASGI